MHNTKVTVSETGLGEYSGELLVFFVAQKDDGNLDCDKFASPLLKSIADYEDFSAKENDTVFLYPQDSKSGSKIGAKRVLYIGLGKKVHTPRFRRNWKCFEVLVEQ